MELPTGIGVLVRTTVVCSALLQISQVAAVEARVYQLENGGAIAPHLTVELGQDDNPLRGENGSEASAFVTLEPELKYIFQRRNNTLTIGYSGQYLQYLDQFCSDPVGTGFGLANSGVDRPGDCASSASRPVDKASFQDHTLGLSGFLEISRRARATFDLSTSVTHQPLGTGLSADDSVLSLIREPDALLRNAAFAGLSYGANQARGELRFGLSVVDRSYRNNGRDLDILGESWVQPSASIFYRVGARTQIFAGLSGSDISGGNSERGVTRSFVGVEFDASAITSGSIRVSDVTEDFDNSTRGDLNYAGFDVDLTWRPRRFSTVTVGAGRETQRATLNEGVGITTNVDVEWLHFWRERLSSEVVLGIQRNESTAGVVNNDANDRTNTLRFEGNYNVRRWLDVGAFVQTEDRTGRNANGQSRDYSRALIGLTANGTF